MMYTYPDRAIPLVARRLKMGQNLVLLCACAKDEGCHRMLVAKLVQDALAEVAS